MLRVSKRLQRRLLRHHLPLFLASALAVVALYATRPYRDVISRASFATAYPAMVLFAWTLLTGPWKILRKRTSPVSDDLRRDLGIWAGILGILHVVVGQNVHLRGRPWLYYIYAAREHHSFPIRHDLFGFANYTGAISTILLILLLATSNDYYLLRLGTPQWKRLQKWNYGAFLFAALHALGYQINEKQKPHFVAIVVASIATALVLQTAGYITRKRARKSPLRPTPAAPQREATPEATAVTLPR